MGQRKTEQTQNRKEKRGKGGRKRKKTNNITDSNINDAILLSYHSWRVLVWSVTPLQLT